MSILRIALAIPCAAHIPERAASLRRLERDLFGSFRFNLSDGEVTQVITSGSRDVVEVGYRAFTDREKWYPSPADGGSADGGPTDGLGWFLRMLRWGAATDADFFLTLQDDVQVAPNFWTALAAMTTAWCSDVSRPECLSLVSNHSQAREQARQGRRSYFTGTAVGWAWGMPMAPLRQFADWCNPGKGNGINKFRAASPAVGEDTMLAHWCREVAGAPTVGLPSAGLPSAGPPTAGLPSAGPPTAGVPIRHPLPTIVDHNCAEMPSTFAGNDLHSHRRSVVTWRDYSPRDMAEPSWWQGYAADLPLDIARACAWCGDREVAALSPRTGIGLCVECMPRALCQWCGEGKVVARAPVTGFGICKDCFMMPGRVFQPFINAATSKESNK